MATPPDDALRHTLRQSGADPLDASLAITDALLHSVDDPALVVSTDGAVLRANAALHLRLGSTAAPIAGRSFWELLGMPRDDRNDPVRSALSRFVMTTREAVVPGLAGQRFRIRAWPAQTAAGRVVGAVVVLQDAGVRARLEEQLKQAQKLSSIGAIVSGVAHELNNPLSAVLGFAELVSAAPAATPDLQKQLTIIRDESRRAAKIVRNLLAFVREHKAERAAASLNDIVQRVTELLIYDFRTGRVKLVLDLDAKLPSASLDANQIQQVLFNLLQNARHAIQEKGDAGTVRVRTRHDPQTVVMTVEDDGGGIKPEAVPRLFEPFFTTKPVGKGTGLGLSVCRGIVEEHGGRLDYENRPGEGVAFHVRLPLTQAPAEPATEPSTGDFRSPKGLKILVVDDEPSAVEFLRRVLCQSNSIVGAVDGRSAIAELKRQRFDLIITDMRMPGLSGRELYAFVAAEQPHLANRVIFTTGDVLSTDTRMFLSGTDIPTIEKPYAARDVLRAVLQVINRPA